jgi:hypothetical protein
MSHILAKTFMLILPTINDGSTQQQKQPLGHLGALVHKYAHAFRTYFGVRQLAAAFIERSLLRAGNWTFSAAWMRMG